MMKIGVQAKVKAHVSPDELIVIFAQKLSGVRFQGLSDIFCVLKRVNSRPHCDFDNHAYRCLANRWLAVLWRLWQDHKPYDETYHLQQRALRSQPRYVMTA